MPKIPGTYITFDSVIALKVEALRESLGLSRVGFVRRLGYENVNRGCRKYMSFLDKFPDQPFILEHLPQACEITRETVNMWVKETEDNIAAALLRAFRPHAVIKTEHEVPRPIFVAAFCGSASHKYVEFDMKIGAPSFVQQVVDIIPSRVGSHGTILAFGKPTGFVINFTPYYARCYDLNGGFIEERDAAFSLGHASIRIGKTEVHDMAAFLERGAKENV